MLSHLGPPASCSPKCGASHHHKVTVLMKFTRVKNLTSYWISRFSWKRKKVLDKLRCDKVGGADELSSRLLIELKEVMCYPVTKIISESLCTGIVPDDWKTANVAPIFKKGNRQRVDNYRPVSLTSLIGKTCETVIRDAILDHLDRHQLIVDSQ